MKTIGGSSSKNRVLFKAAIGRSSKKLITDKQSTHAVIYNDDLLIEILLRLPVISLLQLKSVCKRWLSLISDPTFTMCRSQIPTLDPPSGLFMQYLGSDKHYFLSFDTQIPCKGSALKNPFSFDRSELHDAKILQSCNGLLLLCCSNTKGKKYYVYNPCINLLKMVSHCLNKSVCGTKLAFDPIKSPHYKVIRAVLVDDHIQIQTYSSETDMWSVYTSRYPRNSFLCFSNGIYWNDALYWYNNPLFFKLDLNVVRQTLTSIKAPRTLAGDLYRPDFRLFVTVGCLLLLCRRYGSSLLMDVYEMRKGYSEWLMKYRVNFNDYVLCPRRLWMHPIVYNIVLGEREEDSFMVVEIAGKTLQYKPAFRTYHELYDVKSTYSDSFQFIASFAGRLLI